MNIFQLMAKNIKKNTKSSVLKRLGYVLVGGVAYPLIPTAIQGILKTDMSGWKGVITGAVGGALVGAASDKVEIAAGAVGAAMTHVMYVKVNDSVNEVLGTPIFRFDPNSQLFDEMPEGMKTVTLPNGQTVMAEIDGNDTELNDSVNNVPGAMLNDYVAEVPLATLPASNNTMSDYVSEVPGATLNDLYNPAMGWGWN